MIEFFKEPDKQKHILISLILVFILGAALNSIALASAITVSIGLVKEVLDDVSTHNWFQKRFDHRGTFDTFDMLADSVGITLGVIGLLAFGVPL